MFRVGEFSKLAKVTVKALRHYDEIGLFRPAMVNEVNGYRLYSLDQLQMIARIVQFKELGFSLSEIKELIDSKTSKELIHSRLIKKQREVQNQINQDSQRLSNINKLIENFKEDTMENVVIKSLPEVIVASKRLVIPTYDALYEVAPAMGEVMKKHGAVCREPAYCFNIYHDDEYKDKDIDLEICEAVVEKLEDKDGLVYKIIDGVKEAACINHKGPYETLSASYGKIMKWIEDEGFKIIDHARESYIDGPWNKKDPQEWLTEIQIPVSKK